ncbi:unnamed protein product [Clonostachys chloroleuca]|uniref:Uncharacterized protein n=1 Tax=Clonostachys chloroleuca TaxID=1926264 RepID=A0AA35LWG3_9HYPO|nr:unnamed protein product [Clonostachys chloroleuca]
MLRAPEKDIAIFVPEKLLGRFRSLFSKLAFIIRRLGYRHSCMGTCLGLVMTVQVAVAQELSNASESGGKPTGGDC